MRQGPNPKRQRGRPNGRRSFHGQSQTFESNGPDVKIRGNALQVLEKYQALARDALASGDRVAAENYLQHAEHYYRVYQANSGNGNAGPGGGRGPNGSGAPQSSGSSESDESETAPPAAAAN